MEIQWMPCYVQWIQSIYILHSFDWHTGGKIGEPSIVSLSRCVGCNPSWGIFFCVFKFIRLLVMYVTFYIFCFLFLIELLRFQNIYVDVRIIQFVTYFSYTIAMKRQSSLRAKHWLWCEKMGEQKRKKRIQEEHTTLCMYHSITIPKSNIDLHKSCTLHTPKLFSLISSSSNNTTTAKKIKIIEKWRFEEGKTRENSSNRKYGCSPF